jgi:hypothetical protein
VGDGGEQRQRDGTTTGAASNFTEHAAPTSNRRPRRAPVDGRSRYANATATAAAANADRGAVAADPGGHEEHRPARRRERGAITPARRPGEVPRDQVRGDRDHHRGRERQHRGAFWRPDRRQVGDVEQRVVQRPCDEKTSRYGRAPWRIARAVAP